VSRTNDKARHQLPVHDPAAVDAGLDELPREALDQIASVGSDELLKMHLVVGSHLCNTLGLWVGNPDLLNACGEPHPGDEFVGCNSALTRFHLADQLPS
jgi:hypothetical protein